MYFCFLLYDATETENISGLQTCQSVCVKPQCCNYTQIWHFNAISTNTFFDSMCLSKIPKHASSSKTQVNDALGTNAHPYCEQTLLHRLPKIISGSLFSISGLIELNDGVFSEALSSHLIRVGRLVQMQHCLRALRSCEPHL